MVVDLHNRITASDKSKHAFSSFKGSIRNSTKAMRGLSASIGAFVGVASIMKLGQMTKEAIQFGSQIEITANKIGFSAKNLQSLRLAGEQFAGVQSTTVDMALQRFSRRLGEADKNSGELKGTLDMLGISTRDSSGNIKTSNDVLLEYADAVKGAESQQERLRMSFKAFDSEGAVLVGLLTQGSEGMRALMESAQSTGAVLSGSTTKQAEKLNEELSLGTTIIKTQFTEAILNLAPVLVSITSLFGGLIKKFNEYTSFADTEARFYKDMEDGNKTIEQATSQILQYYNLRAKAQAEGDEAQVRHYDQVIAGGEAYIQSLKGVNTAQEETKGSFTSFVNSFGTGLKDIQKNLPTVAEEGKKFAVSFQSGLEGAFDSILDGTKSVGDALKDFGKTLLKQAIKMLIFRTILAPIGGALGIPMSGFGKKMGGSVSKGRPYMVGDGGNGSGAELFVPNQSGTIVPNNKLGGGGVTVVQNISLSGDVSAQIRSQVMSMLPGIADASRGAVLEAQRRGQPS